MKLTELYISILAGVGLKVDDEFLVRTSEKAEQVHLNISFDGNKKKQRLAVINKEATYKQEPSDIVRFHPLGESIFDPPSETVRFFVKQMENDLVVRIAELTVKLAELAEIKKNGGDLTSKQMKYMKNIPYTKSALKYFKQCLARVGIHKKPPLVTITNKRSYVYEDVKHSRVCIVKTDPMDYTEEEGVFGHKADTSNSFKMTKGIFSNILENLDTVAVSNIKSSPTFISMLIALGTYSREVNSIANALWRTNTNPVYRDVSWISSIDDLPSLYLSEHPVQYSGNVGENRVEAQETALVETVEEVVEEQNDDASLLPQSVTPDDSKIETITETVTETVTETPQIENKEKEMFNSIPAPRVRIGAGAQQPVQQSQDNSIFDNVNTQQPSQQQQPSHQQQQLTQQPMGRIVSDNDAKNADNENIVHLKSDSESKPAARETATSCHAVDLHGQPLFRYDGSPYIIKGSQNKVSMIHRADLDGTLLFKSNGDPLLGPLTYKQDGTPNGIRNVGRIGGNRQPNQQQHQQQSQNLFNQPQQNTNSLASRLTQGGQNNGAIFGNQQNANFGGQQAQLNNQQIQQLQRAGIPDENIRAYMQTGDKRYLDRNVNIGLGQNQNNQMGGMQSGLSMQDRKTTMEAATLLFKNGKLGNDKAIQIKRALESNTLSASDAQKIVQMARQASQQQSSIFGNDSSGGSMFETETGGPDIGLF